MAFEVYKERSDVTEVLNIVRNTDPAINNDSVEHQTQFSACHCHSSAIQNLMFGVKLLTTCLTNISVYMYTSKLIIKKTFKDYNPALEPGPLDPVCHEIHNFNKDTARRMISSQLGIMQ